MLISVKDSPPHKHPTHQAKHVALLCRGLFLFFVFLKIVRFNLLKFVFNLKKALVYAF